MFKSPNSDTYVIFGEAKIEDLAAQGAASAAEQFRMQDATPNVTESRKAPEPEPEEEEEGEVDETGVEPKDIELVMTQAGVSRARAVKALKAADGDLITAIMDLTH